MTSSTLLWVADWTRPFESDESLQVKLAWLNQADRDKFGKYGYSIRNRTGAAYRTTRLTKRHEMPPLAVLLRHSVGMLSFCQDCVVAGYHSHFPQLAGFTNCPIHHCNLTSICPHCKRNIGKFALSNFRDPAVYLCGQCKQPLSPSRNVLSDWLNLSDEKIRCAYSSIHTTLQPVINKTYGYWHIHPALAPAIYNSIVGNKQNERRTKCYERRFAPVAGKIECTSYSLPMKESAFRTVMDEIVQYDQLSVFVAKRFFAREIDPWYGYGRRLPHWHIYESKLECPRDFDLVFASMAIREQLLAVATRPTSMFPPLWAFAAPEKSQLLCHRQLRQLIAAHSLFTIISQLRMVQYLHRRYFDHQQNLALAKRQCNRLANFFSGTFDIQSFGHEMATYQVSIERWLPSFRVHQVAQTLLLDVYSDSPDLTREPLPKKDSGLRSVPRR